MQDFWSNIVCTANNVIKPFICKMGEASGFGTHFELIAFISMDYNIFVKQKPFTLR